MSGAGFSASTVLSDVPIQQLLALGVSSLASPVAIEAAAAAMAIAALWGLAVEYFMRESAPVPGAAAEPETAPGAGSGAQHANSWIARPPWLLKVVVGVPLGTLLSVAFHRRRLEPQARHRSERRLFLYGRSARAPARLPVEDRDSGRLRQRRHRRHHGVHTRLAVTTT